ncbi:MAG TPA: hypothetical protein DEH22_16650 [Chloroflexi bacterium]|nr:hypothetical protein [Chloroflexota bacterium]
MQSNLARFKILIFLVAGILVIFAGYVLFADIYPLPRLFEIFDTIIVLGSLMFLLKNYQNLHRHDWIIGIMIGAIVGMGMCFATLFSPYPFFGMINSHLGQAFLRGFFTSLATLSGLAIMRQGGPVQFRAANGEWHQAGKSLLFGFLVGFPLAALNVFALQISEGQPIAWQNPLAALLDALQPAIVEEMIYRFAFLGLLWFVLRGPLPNQATWISGLLALLVHNFAHFSDLLLDAPLIALGMGTAMAVIWGLPLTILALRRDIDSAIAFHWVQDLVRFLAGF